MAPTASRTAKLAGAARGQVRDYAVQPNARQQQRKHREGTDQHQIQALCEKRSRDEIGHRKDVVERLVGIDFSNRGANRRCHRRRVARCFDHHGHAILGALGIRPIDLRTRIAVQPFVANVTHYAEICTQGMPGTIGMRKRLPIGLWLPNTWRVTLSSRMPTSGRPAMSSSRKVRPARTGCRECENSWGWRSANRH